MIRHNTIRLADIKDPGLRAAIKAAGSKYRLAQLLGLTPASVQVWRRVPAERVVDVEKATGVSRTKLRPELFENMNRE